MEKVSVIMPSRNEEYLGNTVRDLLEKAEGAIEIIVVLDGPSEFEVPRDLGVVYIENAEPKGMRNAINTAAKKATGKYLMKCDAHCCFDKSFDMKLKKDCKPDWTVVPRRYAIDKRNWDRHPDKKYTYDFQYIGHPDDPEYAFKGVNWPEYGVRVKGQKLCDLMTSQGSCWFMFRDRFFELGGLDEENYGTMGAEAQEVCLKSWLSGGRYVLNRNTWYAHKKKRQSVKHRGYRKPVGQWRKSRAAAKDIWLNNKWEGQTRDLEWLIKKFAPVPGWHTRWSKVKSERLIQNRFKLGYARDSYPQRIDGLNRDGLVKLWKKLGYKVGAEVGVDKGDFSKMIMEGIPGLKLYCIDPWKHEPGMKKYSRSRSSALELAEKALDGHNVEFIQELSEVAFRRIPERSLDFVYIDGNHKYDWVMLDIILWQRKVRSGGMISGHDYTWQNGTVRRGKYREVKRAVDHYTEMHEIAPIYLTDRKNVEVDGDRFSSWFWIK